MQFIENILSRNKDIIESLLKELDIKDSYEYLTSQEVSSIFLSIEKDKDDPLGIGLGGRARLVIKYMENDTLKRKAIKNLTFPKDIEGFENVMPINIKMVVLVQLFREQKLLIEFLQLEEGLKFNNNQLAIKNEAFL